MDINWWWVVYAIGSLYALWQGTMANNADAKEYPMIAVWIVTIFWFIFIPPAIILAWKDDE